MTDKWEEAATEVLENNVELWEALYITDTGDSPTAGTSNNGVKREPK